MAGWSITGAGNYFTETASTIGEFITNNLWNCDNIANISSFTVKFEGNVGTPPYFTTETTYTIPNDCEGGCEPIVAWFSNGCSSVNNDNINYVRMKRIDCEFVVLRSDNFDSNPYVLHPNFENEISYTGQTNSACVSCSNNQIDATGTCENYSFGNCERHTKIEVSSASHVVKFWLNKNAENRTLVTSSYRYFVNGTPQTVDNITSTTKSVIGTIINPKNTTSTTMITNNNKLVRLYIPGNGNGCDCYVSGIGMDSFKDNKYLTAVTIGCFVGVIGKGAFANCSRLTEIEFPTTSFYIDTSAFASCSSVTTLDLSNAVSIGEQAFAGCTSLTSVTLSGSIQSIEDGAFNGCANLQSITINRQYPPYLGSNAIPQTFLQTQNSHIYVPSSSVTKYQEAYGWGDYASKIVGIN